MRRQAEVDRNPAIAPDETTGDVRLDEYVDRIAEELHLRVEHQRAVIKQALCAHQGRSKSPSYCPLVDCPKLTALREVIVETVNALEETRSSFKSKRLEVMRKRLIDVLSSC